MTVVSGTAQTSSKRGLTIERRFTTGGVNPFSTVEWETSDVVMTNWRDGKVNFEQRGVEFPAAWSANARQIVTSKYFRGQLDTPGRERSLKQLINRVVDTYTRHGLSFGYFATDEDAAAFQDELKYMLLHQMFAFNSPVWFNIGTSAPQQVSACQPYGALVSTPEGMIPIGRLVEDDAVGAKVYDAHGVTSVVATKANGVKDVLRIHTKAGHALDVTADHVVWKSTGQGTGRWVEAGTLAPGDQLEWHRRVAFGEAEVHPQWIAEAALAGWMQSDGCVAQYPGSGNPSLIFEAMTVNDDELRWVRQAIDAIWPDAIIHKPVFVKTQDTSLDCRRTRMSGKYLESFAEDWGLRARGTAQVVPPQLFAAPLPIVAAYLRSLFQAEGYVSQRERSCYVGLGMISEELIRGVQALLARFGIFARVSRHVEKREDRHDLWVIGIQNAGDRRIFADEIGFIGADKAAKLEASFDIPGRPALDVKRLEIALVEHLGPQEVYDIQTESGEYLSGSLRVHNCFLLSVDDDMPSILNWIYEEGMIFKGGSGAGVNLSRIRSSKELMSSGGTASGPVSFMRGADASAGAIKSGGSTRRAAKLVCLDVDHPDILEFVRLKSEEERKIKALRDAGFDMALDGKDTYSVQYQNANNSVRLSDEFMRAVERGLLFQLRNRLDGSVADVVDARELFRAIAQCSWECADPGVQYDDTINSWHTCPESGRITTSNPCSEYMHLDNSSCNLASLNLLKFLSGNGNFRVDDFIHAVEMVITAMDISVSFADFPTEKITEVSRAYRQLGIGYCNLGALAMSMGRAYDSDAGRSLAGAVTSLMSAVSWRRSAELATVLGAYDGFARNSVPHRAVLARHRNESRRMQLGTHDPEIFDCASRIWDEALQVGIEDGYRNAQVSLIAPTGTISFMMDADTTGIEPDFALVKHKRMVGGSETQIVNRAVDRALQTLGYSPSEIVPIEEWILEHGHVVDAPGLDPQHYAVFDCAVGDRSIAPGGHIQMMAAVQPFLCGAISKTVNLPESATVEDIEQVHMDGWRLGLKSLAVYRDNCKAAQPLSTKKKDSTPKDEPAPTRHKLPHRRPSVTTSIHIGEAEAYLTASRYPDNGIGEIFLKMGKQGSTLTGLVDAFSIAISVALQHGVPLETYVAKFAGMRFEPAGVTNDPELRMTTSIVDYVFRRLALDYLPAEKRQVLGIYSNVERAELLEATEESPDVAVRHSVLDAPLCHTCGIHMVRAGVCFVCSSCGTTSGCS